MDIKNKIALYCGQRGVQLSNSEVDEIMQLYSLNHSSLDEHLLNIEIDKFLTRKARENNKWKENRRFSVNAQNIENTAIEITPKSQKDVDFLLACMKGRFPFESLNSEQKHKLILTMYTIKLAKGHQLIREGDQDAYEVYIIDEGEFNIYAKGNYLRTLKRGGYFGQLALLHNCARTASVYAKTEAKVWVASQVCFSKIRIAEANRARDVLTEALKLHKVFEENLCNSVAGQSFISFKNTGISIELKEGDLCFFISDAKIMIEGNIYEKHSCDIEVRSFVAMTDVQYAIINPQIIRRKVDLSVGRH